MRAFVRLSLVMLLAACNRDPKATQFCKDLAKLSPDYYASTKDCKDDYASEKPEVRACMEACLTRPSATCIPRCKGQMDGETWHLKDAGPVTK